MANLLFIPLVLIVGYLLLVRPQQQRVRRQQELLASIRVGDQVVTAGGMIGTVESLDSERVWIELAPGMTVQFLRQAIARKLEALEAEADRAEHGDAPEDDVVQPGAVDHGDGVGGHSDGVGQLDGSVGPTGEEGAEEERGERA